MVDIGGNTTGRWSGSFDVIGAQIGDTERSVEIAYGEGVHIINMVRAPLRSGFDVWSVPDINVSEIFGSENGLILCGFFGSLIEKVAHNGALLPIRGVKVDDVIGCFRNGASFSEFIDGLVYNRAS